MENKDQQKGSKKASKSRKSSTIDMNLSRNATNRNNVINLSMTRTPRIPKCLQIVPKTILIASQNSNVN